jgi:hypothetical protein
MTSRVFIPLVLSGVFVIALIPGRAQQAPPRPQAAAAGSADGAVLKQY